MPSQIQVFLSQFTQYEQKLGMPKNSLRRLPGLLRSIIEEEIPARDEMFHINIRDLTNSKKLALRINSESSWCYPKGEECLMTGTVYPYWRRGLHSICKDEYLYDAISTFFHFASQYISRSRVVDLIGAIAIEYNRACDFRGNTLIEFVGNKENTVPEFKRKYCSEVFKKTKYRGSQKRLVYYFNLFNSLDPFIHRLLFNYVRAIDLFEKCFAEEAITALDNTINVSEQFVRERLGISSHDQRIIVAYVLGMTPNDCRVLKRIYDLRCYFGAHPSMSKWWDFFEIYDQDFDEMFETVKKLVIKTAEAEEVNRVVEKNPKVWSQWLNSNLLMIWNSVWFHKLP